MKAHHVANRVVQDEAKHVERRDPLQHAGQVADEALEVAVRGCARDTSSSVRGTSARASAHTPGDGMGPERSVDRDRGMGTPSGMPTSFA